MSKKPDEEVSKRRPYPRHVLKDALIIGQAIQDNNAGKPMRRLLVADAISRTPTSSEFKYLLSSSAKYGLTIGTEKADVIELTSVGQSITKPISAEEKMKALQKACMTPESFKRFYEHYKDAKVPNEEFVKNILEREYEIPREHTQECYQMIIENGKFAGIIRDISGSPRVFFDDVSTPISESSNDQDEDQNKEQTQTAPPITQTVPIPPQIKQIFVAHGKNRKPLEQLEKILNKFRVNYKIAIDEPHRGRPVSAKVAELMKECTSGIFIFTADEKTIDKEGKEAWRPSDNVVYELGAASLLYGKKIVIFKEDDVSFASDFSDLGYISFEKDKLDTKTADLMIELINLGFMQLTPA